MLMPKIYYLNYLKSSQIKVSAFVTLWICYYNTSMVAKLEETKQVDCKSFDKLEVRI